MMKLIKRIKQWWKDFIKNHIIDEIDPDVIMKQDFKCPMCGHGEEVEIPITVNFFWPES